MRWISLLVILPFLACAAGRKHLESERSPLLSYRASPSDDIPHVDLLDSQEAYQREWRGLERSPTWGAQTPEERERERAKLKAAIVKRDVEPMVYDSDGRLGPTAPRPEWTSGGLRAGRVRAVPASPIESFLINVPPRQPVEIRTYDLSPGGDSEIYVVSPDGRTQVAWNDDFLVGSFASEVLLSPEGEARRYRILISPIPRARSDRAGSRSTSDRNLNPWTVPSTSAATALGCPAS